MTDVDEAMDDDVGVPVPEATIAEVEIVTPCSSASLVYVGHNLGSKHLQQRHISVERTFVRSRLLPDHKFPSMSIYQLFSIMRGAIYSLRKIAREDGEARRGGREPSRRGSMGMDVQLLKIDILPNGIYRRTRVYWNIHPGLQRSYCLSAPFISRLNVL